MRSLDFMQKKIDENRELVLSKFPNLFISPMQARRGAFEFPNMWEYAGLFLCLMELDIINREKKREFDKLLMMKGKANLYQELVKLKMFDNQRVLEIGGYFSMNLGLLGAIAEKRDAAISDDEYITLQNYKEKLGTSQYDITMSKELFDQCSGIENGKGFNDACIEMLGVFSLLTRVGGISIHDGRMDEVLNDKLLEKLRFEKLHVIVDNRAKPPYKIYVFKKY